MAVIKVPKTPKRAFNKNRPASGLIRAQIEHLEAAVGIYRRQSATQRKAGTVKRPKAWTEGQAAAYIGQLTGQIHAQADTPQVAAESTSTRPTEPTSAKQRVRTKPQRSRPVKTRPKTR